MSHANLSFDKGADNDAVAIVKGGKFDGEILYLHKQDEKRVKEMPKKEICKLKYQSHLKGVKPTERVKLWKKIEEALDKKAEELIGESSEIKELYHQIKDDYDKDKSVELHIDSIYMPIPSADPTKRQIWYAAGASGSGKSYFAKNIAESYKKLWPDRPVYLISQLKYDDTLDSMKVDGKPCPPKRIDYMTFKEDGIPDLEELKDSMVLFDDYDVIQEPYGKLVQQLIDEIAIEGRHYNISMCVLSHYLSNYKKTRLILNECQYMVLYPNATSQKALQYVCQHYCGLDKEDIQKLKKLGRWVMVSKNFPPYLIASHTAHMLNQ